MTDHLTDLLQRRADRIDVPHPPTTEVLSHGRRLRRRRHAVAGGVAGGALALTLVGALLLVPGGAGGPDRADDLTAAQPAPSTWAVAAGSEVALSTGATARVEGTVKSVYYTSAGVLVRTGDSATTDAVDSGYSLVEDDGSLTDFALELGDRVPATDPTLPYLAYTVATDDPDAWEVVLRDVRDGDVVRRIRVEGAFTWGGWVAPPVSLSGDHVYVGLDETTLDVEWRTGDAGPSPLPSSTMPEVQSGRAVVESSETSWRVIDAQSGAEVAAGDLSGAAFAALSPDGAHVVLVPWRTCQGEACSFDRTRAPVIDLQSGTEQQIDLADGLGWTSTGDLLLVAEDRVERCAPDTGACAVSGTPVPSGELRLGGTSYEA